MIISHKYKFIFIKNKRTAGTSIESYLSQFLGDKDIIAPHPYIKGKNYHGWFNPILDLLYCLKNIHSDDSIKYSFFRTPYHLLKGKRYYEHIPAVLVKSRVSRDVWDSYFKFCFERNPWDKVISMYQSDGGRGLSFEYFMNSGKWKWCINYPLYTDFWGNNVIVDYVGKFGNLKEDLKQISNKLEIPFKGLPKYRSSRRHQNYRDFFKGEYKKYVEIISKEYKKEIDLHNFKF